MNNTKNVSAATCLASLAKRLAIVFAILPAMYSCVTDDYDLSKDMDGSICFAPDGFSLGGDNSADIPLSQVIELSDSGQLTTDASGNYLFYKSRDDMEPTTVTIGQGSLCNAFDMTHTMSFANASAEASPRYTGFSNVTFTATTPLACNPDELQDGIVELIYITTPMTIAVQTIIDSKAKDFCDNITLTYDLPSFYDLENESELNETIKKEDFGKTHEHVIHLKGVDFTKNGIKSGERIGIDKSTTQIIMQGNVSVHGKALVNTQAYRSALASNPAITFYFMVGTLGTTNVKGRFNKKENVDIEPITLDNLPDFIHEEGVIVDVDNPVVRVSLDNEVPAEIALNAKLKGFKDNKYISQVNAGDEYGTDRIVFHGALDTLSARRTTVWISRKATEIPDSVESNVVIADMNNLIRTIPERVDVEATANTDSTQVVTLSLAKEYKATPRYELVAPLKIGPEMKIVYTKTIDDLQDHIKDAEATRLSFSGDITNNIPLDLHVDVIPMDGNGNVISDITVSTTDVIPGNGTKSACFTLSSSDAKAIQKIYTIQVKAYAESSESLAGQYLNKDQNLRIANARITLTNAKYKL